MVRWIMTEGKPCYSPLVKFVICKASMDECTPPEGGKPYDGVEKGLCYIADMRGEEEVIVFGRGEDKTRIHHLDPYTSSPVYYSNYYIMNKEEFNRHFNVIFDEDLHYLPDADKRYGKTEKNKTTTTILL